MHSYSLVLISILFCNQLFAQDESLYFSSQPDIELKENLAPECFNRSITWNVQNFKYYTTAVDSNSTNIETFDAFADSKGVHKFDFLAKGIWYNTTLDFLEAFNYSDNSCYSFFIDDNGEFENTDLSLELESLQEKGTSVFPTYNLNKDLLVYYEPVASIILEIEPISGDILNYIPVTLPAPKKSIAIQQLLYTEIPEYPYALVNTADRKVHLFTPEGLLSHNINWPNIEGNPRFFGFTNGAFWMYNEADTSWKGYAIH